VMRFGDGAVVGATIRTGVGLVPGTTAGSGEVVAVGATLRRGAGVDVGATVGAEGVDVGAILGISARAVDGTAVGELLSHIFDGAMMGTVDDTGTSDGISTGGSVDTCSCRFVCC
jgi:hypothetical protein